MEGSLCNNTHIHNVCPDSLRTKIPVVYYVVGLVSEEAIKPHYLICVCKSWRRMSDLKPVYLYFLVALIFFYIVFNLGYILSYSCIKTR